MGDQISGLRMGQRQAELAERLLKFSRENWIIIAGIFAGGWASGWTIFQWLSNRSIPFNVSISLASAIDSKTTEASAASSEARPAWPVSINVRVENKSGWRELAIRNPTWVAYGFRLESPVNAMGQRVNSIKPDDLVARINRGLASDVNSPGSMKAIGDRRLIEYSYTKEPIGAGQLLGDQEIKPAETLHSQLILPVARGAYDIVQIRILVPTLNQLGEGIANIKAPLQVLSRNEAYEPEVGFCRIQGRGCMPLSKQELKALGAQTHSSVSEIWLGSAAGPASQP